jgi:type II pantothenate kinase
LAKVVYFTRDRKSDHSSGGGRLNFTKFETEEIEDCIAFLKRLVGAKREPRGRKMCVMATGGGSYKFYERMKKELDVEVVQEDEMECLIVGTIDTSRRCLFAGLDFFIQEIPSEVFTFSPTDKVISYLPPRTPPSPIYPYLLCNIGSGVSMLKVSAPNTFERIGGSSLGGGTLWGLLSLLTPAAGFDEMLNLSETGDNTNVDMLVGDIYGADYLKVGLKSSTIASTFGKVARKSKERGPDSGPLKGFNPQDISRSLLFAISNNIGQITYLQAQLHDLQHIYFGGSFIRGMHPPSTKVNVGHTITMNTLSYAIKFWSKGTKQAYFLRHEGYLGSIGAFLRHQPTEWIRRFSATRRDIIPFVPKELGLKEELESGTDEVTK